MQRGGTRRDRAVATRLRGLWPRSAAALREAERLYTEALAEYRAEKDEASEAIVLNDLGSVAQAQKAYDRAEGYYHQALAIDERRGDKPTFRTSNNAKFVAKL